ncbi:hypothetical protein SASPL_130824 [Salvia splendens]|uniref:Uncharacterized protein n=1 Tax=Salvia splendens TaxID=180675 RepID=A0A8X8X8X9_SALSN|nr:uncharacterized protein LOC121756060 [Salvia splendens]XP_042007453.1 uncharacterized protein LOC121756060 [Salvia splendens]KAG6407825.1 hypothetical protein SASPL_130824 [Salvia splendens]
MNRYAIHQNSFAAYEEVRGRSAEMKETVICPKPRRLGLLQTTLHDPRPLRWHASHHQELFDSKAGSELLDIILAKGGCGSDQAVPPVASSSPPFFSGSPPSRVSNPLIQDARFGAERCSPVSPSSTRKGGCVRVNFGNNPAVRVEGFECLDRDRRNCSIPALA